MPFPRQFRPLGDEALSATRHIRLPAARPLHVTARAPRRSAWRLPRGSAACSFHQLHAQNPRLRPPARPRPLRFSRSPPLAPKPVGSAGARGSVASSCDCQLSACHGAARPERSGRREPETGKRRRRRIFLSAARPGKARPAELNNGPRMRGTTLLPRRLRGANLRLV